MIEDLTMLATLPVDDAALKQAQDEADKAAAGETMPPPKTADDDAADSPDGDRVARRGQNPPTPEPSDDQDHQ